MQTYIDSLSVSIRTYKYTHISSYIGVEGILRFSSKFVPSVLTYFTVCFFTDLTRISESQFLMPQFLNNRFADQQE